MKLGTSAGFPNRDDHHMEKQSLPTRDNTNGNEMASVHLESHQKNTATLRTPSSTPEQSQLTVYGVAADDNVDIDEMKPEEVFADEGSPMRGEPETDCIALFGNLEGSKVERLRNSDAFQIQTSSNEESEENIRLGDAGTDTNVRFTKCAQRRFPFQPASYASQPGDHVPLYVTGNDEATSGSNDTTAPRDQVPVNTVMGETCCINVATGEANGRVSLSEDQEVATNTSSATGSLPDDIYSGDPPNLLNSTLAVDEKIAVEDFDKQDPLISASFTSTTGPHQHNNDKPSDSAKA